MTKANTNLAMFIGSIVGALGCFALAQPYYGALLIVFATGHALQSPLHQTPGIKQTKKRDES